MGILIAAVIHPAVDYCELKGCPRGLVSLILVLIIFGSLLFLIGFAVVGLWNEVDQLIQSEEHTSELQSRPHLGGHLLLEKKKTDIAGGAMSKVFGCGQKT